MAEPNKQWQVCWTNPATPKRYLNSPDLEMRSEPCPTRYAAMLHLNIALVLERFLFGGTRRFWIEEYRHE